MFNPAYMKHAVDTAATTGVVLSWAGYLSPIVTVVVGILAGLWYVSRFLDWLVPNRVAHVRSLIDQKGDTNAKSNVD